MQSMNWFIAGFFLPLFPMSMIFNLVFQNAPSTWMKVVLLLGWPVIGIWLLDTESTTIPDWLFLWAIFTATLYAFRSAVIKEISIWIGFIATSAWSLVWVAESHGARFDDILMHVLAFSIPLALLAILVSRLENQYESAYAGVVTGLAQVQPRMTGILVVVMLAAIGSPVFPSFFSLLNNINIIITEMPVVAIGVALVWLLWSWSAIRLLQELIVGMPTIQQHHDDIGMGQTLLYSIVFILLVFAGMYMSEVML